MSKSVLVIGGGVSGLSCAIRCLRYGYEVTVLEKNPCLGGNLTGWHKNECYIDNCIHWLNGTKDGNDVNKLWKEVGAIDEHTRFFESKYFYVSSFGNEYFGLGKNLDETQTAMLSCCNGDERAIKKFVTACKMCCKLLGCDNAALKAFYSLRLFGIYRNETLTQVAASCKTERLKRFFTDFILGEYSVYTLLFAYCSFVIGDGKVPLDGSLNMAKRIGDKFAICGGKAETRCKAVAVNIDGGNATSVLTADGRTFSADAFVFACDPKITFSLLGGYMPKKMKNLYADRRAYPIISSFHVAYKVNLPSVNVPDSFVFECEPIIIGASKIDRLMLKNYDYGFDFAPQDSCVIQIFILQRECDYDYFELLPLEEYEKEKQRIARQITNALVNRFAFLAGKIKILDCWTPLTYNHFFGAYKGSYMSFGIGHKAILSRVNSKIDGLNNCFLATQWQSLFGGLPNALTLGAACADAIKKEERSG